MKQKEKLIWITRTAVFIALLLAVQLCSKPLGQYITGSLVNLLLILSVLLGGVGSGAAVALISPAAAFFLGIGPALPPVIPFIALGNLCLVLVWHYCAGRKTGIRQWYIRSLAALLLGAGSKFLILYFGIVQWAIPVILRLPAAQSSAVSSVFSFPQLVTAVLGGAAAIVLFPLLLQALPRHAD